MSLFQVPGWSVGTAPVRNEPQHVSKKRKRPSTNTHKLETAEINIEKLISKMAPPLPEKSPKHSKGKVKAWGHGPKTARKKQKLAAGADSKVARPHASSHKANPRSSPSMAKPKKTTKANQPSFNETASKRTVAQVDAASPNLTALQKGMKESLDGARFRLINEALYKSNSHAAHQMMQEDPKVFEEYHTGFRHQVLSWPTNPVEHYISRFSFYPKKTIIADLGCGDAALARSLLPKGISVLSFDLVADGKFVVEADICDKIPLPGSEPMEAEKTGGDGQIVDVVVCALSLMGVNWFQCLREAWRILKLCGELHIAEVTSRFTDIEQFQSLIGSIGFRLKAKDESNTHFVLFEFVKVARTSMTEKDWSKSLSRGTILEPCEYKRR